MESGGKARLRLGCLRSYGGPEFHRAVAAFSDAIPMWSCMTTGSHEAVRTAGVRPSRLAAERPAAGLFGGILQRNSSRTALPGRAGSPPPIAQREAVAVEELKDFPCIIVSSAEQWDTERAYYREIVGLQGNSSRWEAWRRADCWRWEEKAFCCWRGEWKRACRRPAPRPAAAKRQAPSAQLLRLLEPGKIQVTMWRNLQNCWGKSFPRRRK